MVQALITLGIVFVLPILLGVLATGWSRRHKGPVACSKCGYELTGLDGKATLCPECGAGLAGAGTLHAGVDRFRASPWWVRYPAVTLLLAAPFGTAWSVFRMYYQSPALSWVPWALGGAYILAVWWTCRVPPQNLVKNVAGKFTVPPQQPASPPNQPAGTISPVGQAMIASHIIENSTTPPASS